MTDREEKRLERTSKQSQGNSRKGKTNQNKTNPKPCFLVTPNITLLFLETGDPFHLRASDELSVEAVRCG